jgi:hypothetical protein
MHHNIGRKGIDFAQYSMLQIPKTKQNAGIHCFAVFEARSKFDEVEDQMDFCPFTSNLRVFARNFQPKFIILAKMPRIKADVFCLNQIIEAIALSIFMISAVKFRVG